MSFRYNPLQRYSKMIYRKFHPVPGSPWTAGHVDDICKVNLVPPEKLQKFFADCLRLLHALKGKEVGDYLEFGVFNGASLSSMYIAAKKSRTKMKFFGFDAFQGLPRGAEKEDDGVWRKGFYSCSFAKMKQCLRRKRIDPRKVTWIKGWYNRTLTRKTAGKIGKIGIVFIDCDTYSSSKSVLNFIAPLIKEPLIICLDDWKLNDLDIKGMGEYKSFNEFLEKNNHLKAKEIKSYNRKSRSFLVYPRTR